MDQPDSVLTAVFIRIIAIIIVLSLYQHWPVLTYGLSMLDGVIYDIKYEDIYWPYLGLATLYILTWLLGCVTAISLFMLKPFSRWLLLAYFITGLVTATTSWIPYGGFLMSFFDAPVLKMISVELPNLIIVVLTFILFHRLDRVIDKWQPQQL